MSREARIVDPTTGDMVEVEYLATGLRVSVRPQGSEDKGASVTLPMLDGEALGRLIVALTSADRADA